ncbi:MAG TPA: hypothetical protein VMF70_14660 [Gemmatimonadales bacterium]|nr:hypothetical protein [Gemmatimonadales bacterium]
MRIRPPGCWLAVADVVAGCGRPAEREPFEIVARYPHDSTRTPRAWCPRAVLFESKTGSRRPAAASCS